MSYLSGNLIEATDYNGLASTNTSNVAWVWGTGFGDSGYGQNTTQIAAVSSTAIITAVQWQGLFNVINRCLGHQGGTQLAGGGNINVAGDTITYFSNVATAITSINTNRLSNAASGTTTTGSNFDVVVSGSTGLSNYTVDRTVTFSSANAARYFFNAGGRLNLVLSTVNSTDNGAENSFGRLVTGLGGISFKANDNNGRTGTGITLNTNLTTHGYYDNLFNSPTTVVQVTDTTTNYTASTAVIQCFYGGTNDTSNGAKGLVLVFRMMYTIADKTWDDTLSLTHRSRVDIVYPSTTYLTDTWGTPTVS
jgi:hypothetical protein